MNPNPTSAPNDSTASAAAQPGASILNVLIIALACSALSGYAAWRLASASRAPAPIVLVDTAKIAGAQLEQTLAKPGLSQTEAQQIGQQFVVDLGRELARYSDAGILVVNSSVVLNRPAGMDVTADVAAALRVELK